eukprot:scaffold32744_cov64-Phaeocystis_antarctica.AAC.3
MVHLAKHTATPFGPPSSSCSAAGWLSFERLLPFRRPAKKGWPVSRPLLLAEACRREVNRVCGPAFCSLGWSRSPMSIPESTESSCERASTTVKRQGCYFRNERALIMSFFLPAHPLDGFSRNFIHERSPR